MEVYTARQAVFNRRRQVVAYELLYREGKENVFPQVDAHEATAKLVVRTELNEGLMAITKGKRALLNFSEQSLLSGLPALLSPDSVVLEILESATPSDELYACCASLYYRGYKLAMDDFVYQPEWRRFFKFIHLIKVDIRKTPLSELAPLQQCLQDYPKIKLLAEKIEEHAEFEQARQQGFDYFQGYFFCKPEMCAGRDVELGHLLLTQLYYEATQEYVNINRVVQYFERDTGLTYKLLRFVNAGHLPLVQDITSIKQAVVYIGNAQLRKLVALLACAMVELEKPRELIRLSVHRARFCELLAIKLQPSLREAAFICGLFSLLDAILDKPLADLLSKLPLEQQIIDALLEDEPSELKHMLSCFALYEQGHWHRTERQAELIRADYHIIEKSYREALDWSEQYQHLVA